MKNLRLMFYINMALIILLAACAPASTPTPTDAPVTQPPAATLAAPTPISTTAPIDLAGPPMQVGSSYLYFDGTLLVAVPGGPFIMGHGGSDNPEHTVTLSDFWIYSTKVTNREFQQCVAVGKCTSPDLQDNQGYTVFERQNDPVVGVNWAQGEAYCEYANGQLPTEAQWEKAARGPAGNIYPWGNGLPAINLLNYNNNIGSTTNVINYPTGKSYYDALDMEGNVYEWVYDWYDPLYYHTGPAQDPLGPDAGVGGQRSVRATGYKSNGDQVPASTRFHFLPTDHARDLGFRCVVKDPFGFAPMCELTALVGGNGGSSSGGNCPNVNVSVTYPPCGQGNYATVTFDDSLVPPKPNITIDTIDNGCTADPPGKHYAEYTCSAIRQGGFNVSITSTCTSSTTVTPTCPAPYKLSGQGECTLSGSGGPGQQCPAGTQYDPLGKCCTFTAGTGAKFPACPAGTFFQIINGVNECVAPGAPGSTVSSSASVDQQPNQNQCGGGTTGNGCIPSINNRYCR